jgi:non-heme chloroperoxidase
MWEYQMTHLTDRGLRCVAYDRRGCGRSDQPGHGYDYDTLADDLAALIDKLDLRGVTLVAHSMAGGDVTRYLACHGAERIARTVLVGTTTPFPLKTADNPDGLDKSVFDEIVAALKADRPSFLAAGAPGFFGVEHANGNGAVSREVMQWCVELFLQASPKATIDMVPMFAETDLRPEMCAFTMPTLVIHGDADHSAPLDITGRKTADAITGSELKVYEGAPHGLFFTHKDRLNADLLEFVEASS